MNKFLNIYFALFISCSALTTTLNAMMEGDKKESISISKLQSNNRFSLLSTLEGEKEVDYTQAGFLGAEELPFELLQMILEGLDHKDIAKLAFTSRYLFAQSQTEFEKKVHPKLEDTLSQGNEEILKSLLCLNVHQLKIIYDNANVLFADFKDEERAMLVRALLPGTVEQLEKVVQLAPVIFGDPMARPEMDGAERAQMLASLVQLTPKNLEFLTQHYNSFFSSKTSSQDRLKFVPLLAKATPEKIAAIQKSGLDTLIPDPSCFSHAHRYLLQAETEVIKSISKNIPSILGKVTDEIENGIIVNVLSKASTVAEIENLTAYFMENPLSENVDVSLDFHNIVQQKLQEIQKSK